MSWNKMDGHSSSSSVQSDQGDGGDSKENIQPPEIFHLWDRLFHWAYQNHCKLWPVQKPIDGCGFRF